MQSFMLTLTRLHELLACIQMCAHCCAHAMLKCRKRSHLNSKVNNAVIETACVPCPVCTILKSQAQNALDLSKGLVQGKVFKLHVAQHSLFKLGNAHGTRRAAQSETSSEACLW